MGEITHLKRTQVVGYIFFDTDYICPDCVVTVGDAEPITAQWAHDCEVILVCDMCGRDLLPVVYDFDDCDPTDRLEYLRSELRAERISYGELCELQTLAEFIDPSDVELLEAAGVPEHAEGD